MVSLVLDSDCLIKLAKSTVLIKLLKHFQCFISKEVYEETVVKGKARLYEDAFLIDELVVKGKLRVKEVKENERALKLLAKGIGRGEASTLILFFNLGADAILTDDKAFIRRILIRNEIPFITSSRVIIRLVRLGIIGKKEGIEALNRLKPYITREDYLTAIKVIKEWR
ncbi:MAG TPA: hypothetical protein ENF62_02285 [Candidatus Bathyarchaeota archaeon]|nr:hypothetical protein [Candidatus Bathyarchaeota archaeon]